MLENLNKKERAEKRKAFEAMMKKQKKKNPNTVYFKDGPSYMPGVMRTGLPSIDLALRCGGLPRKRILELYGPEHSGKTTFALHLIAEVQKQGGNVIYLDAENSLDPEWAEKLGVNIDEMGLFQQIDAHNILDHLRDIVRSNTCDMFVVDSVAALTTKSELEGEMGDHHVAEQARLVKDLMKVINIDLLPTETIALFTNQVRNKIGVSFGSNETRTGGNAFRHYASICMEVKKASDEGAYKAGHHLAKIKVSKNKLGPPFGIGFFRIDPAVGILKTYSIVDPAVELGVIQHPKGSKTYEYHGKTWTFEGNLIKALEQDELLRNEITEAIYKKIEETRKAEPATNTTPEELIEDDTEENTDGEVES